MIFTVECPNCRAIIKANTDEAICKCGEVILMEFPALVQVTTQEWEAGQ